RLKQLSMTLDKKEVFIGCPWVLLDEDHNKETYIFKRNGELVMSMNGMVNIGKWEYLPEAKALLIDRVRDKILLQQEFINNTLMILKMDGVRSTPFILANSTLLPDLNVEKYLRSLTNKVNNVKTITLKDGSEMEVYNYNYDTIINKKVHIDNLSLENCELVDEKNRIITIRQGVIKAVRIKANYNTSKGMLTIEQLENYGAEIGDRAYLPNSINTNGKFYIDGKWLTIQDGVIVKIKDMSLALIALLIVAIVVTILLALAFTQ